MKPFYILSILALTALTFFAATRSISAKTKDLDNVASSASMEVQDFAAKEESYLTEISDLEAELKKVLEAENTATSDTTALETELQATRTALDAAEEKRDELFNSNGTLQTELVAFQDDASSWAEQSAALHAEIAQRDSANQAQQQAVETLDQKLASAEAEVQNLGRQIVELENTIASMTSDAAQPDPRLGQLEEQLAQKDDALDAAEDRIAELTVLSEEESEIVKINEGQVNELNLQLAVFRSDVADLTAAVTERDAMIEELRAQVVTPQSLSVATCSENMKAILSEERIDFENGKDIIRTSSYSVLESLAGTALKCVQSDHQLTIGGHTDSQGGEVSNQRLSAARAEAIRSFFAVRGLPTQSMTVVGYGESNPIADNSTSEGRSLNRRITFEWE